jgi:hypothetical protein
MDYYGKIDQMILEFQTLANGLLNCNILSTDWILEYIHFGIWTDG